MNQIAFFRRLFENDLIDKFFDYLKNKYRGFMKYISRLMIDYDIIDDTLSVSYKKKKKLIKEAEEIVKDYHKSVSKKEVTMITNTLKNAIDDFQKFWGYNIDKKDTMAMLKENFKGKHFSERVWDNEQEVAARLNKLLRDFINGKMNINQVKSDIEKTFNTTRYNAKRLVDTETARLHDKVFKRYCKANGVTWIKWNAILDERVCDECASLHGKSYRVSTAPELPRHPNCRCFFEVDVKKEAILDTRGEEE